MIENERGEPIPATCFEKATYKLHPSFEARATQSMQSYPHACASICMAIDDSGAGSLIFVF